MKSRATAERCSTRRLPVLVSFALLLSPIAAGAQESDPGHAAMVHHAEALLLENDGNPNGALELLRQAHALAPNDPDIAFDLARVAQKSGLGRPDDVEPFLAMPAETTDARLLRALILGRRGERAGANEAALAVLADRPGDPAATTLARLLEPGPTPKAWTLRAGMLGQYDTNVSVVGDEPGADAIAAPRAVLQVGGTYEAVKGLGLFLTFQGAPHLERGPEIEPYDSGLLSLGATYLPELPGFVASAQLALTQVTNDLFANRYMQEAFFRGQILRRLDDVGIGAYLNLGYRDFTVPSLEKKSECDGKTCPTDRDGAVLGGGLRARFGTGPLELTGHAGYQLEPTQGDDQAERGPELALAAQMTVADLRLSGGAGVQLRDYWRTDYNPDPKVDDNRSDLRLGVSLGASYPVIEQVDLVLGYAFVRNFEDHDTFDYSRHLVQAGVEAAW